LGLGFVSSREAQAMWARTMPMPRPGRSGHLTPLFIRPEQQLTRLHRAIELEHAPPTCGPGRWPAGRMYGARRFADEHCLRNDVLSRVALLSAASLAGPGTGSLSTLSTGLEGGREGIFNAVLMIISIVHCEGLRERP
jgi:hypothetical protein